MKIGGHVSTSGGILNAFERAQTIGANCFQIFTSSPRMWQVPEIDSVIANTFKEKISKTDIVPGFAHIKYLVNLGSPNDDVAQKSLDTVKKELLLCSQLGLKGAMFHIGSPKGSALDICSQKVVAACKEISKEIPENVLLILENSSSATKIGSTFEEIAYLLDEINSSQVAVCLDTAHAFAAGYELRTAEAVNAFVEHIEEYIGFDNLALIHANDSKADIASGRDLHENIGKGKIGESGFTELLNHPKLQYTPFILEVPGYDDSGPDKQNIDTLKRLYRSI